MIILDNSNTALPQLGYAIYIQPMCIEFVEYLIKKSISGLYMIIDWL